MKIITTMIACAAAIFGQAQNELYNNGTTLYIAPGAVLQVNGSFTNGAGSTHTNKGTLTVTGDITNNASQSWNEGTLIFKGATAQAIGGSAAMRASHVVVDNAAGVTLNNKLIVEDGDCTFTNGIITAGSVAAPLWFAANATHSGASNASHVNGYVVKEGTSSFTYPVGDGTNYQKVTVNPTANNTGIQVTYNATDAGDGTFTTTGTDATALADYNYEEHWDITPLSTATATVTLYWDSYKSNGTGAIGSLRVAHKTGGNWLNEGGTSSGTIAAGSITSNILSSWSPFTLGFTATILPVNWLSINGSLTNQMHASINWRVVENNVAKYVVEKSIDARSYSAIGTVNSIGNGTNTYQYTEGAALAGTAYYRIKQSDKNGSQSYSTIVKLSNMPGTGISVYPNPAKDKLTIAGATIGSAIIVTDISGKVLQQVNIKETSFTLDISKYSSGVYVLKMANGVSQKFIKD